MASTFSQRVINFDDWREIVFFLLGAVGGIVILALTILVGVGLLTWDSEVTVSGPVTISSEWAELTPRKPLVPAKQYQLILLEVDPSEALVVDNLHLEHIQLGNGIHLKPEIQLIDSQGNVFVAEVYRSPVPSYLDNSIVGNVESLPQDRKYTKVRVRSNAPVRLSRIIWYCSKMK